ncbi:MAG TPA: ABC transporter permease [Chthoniobacteraceae bacterium]|nr:ABC transporter permease [Chthoniobacteraceae bacterium]
MRIDTTKTRLVCCAALKAPFSLFFALRYLRPKRSFVSVISIITVLGVAVGIMSLIVVLAVMTGFDHELRKKVLGFEPHLFASGPEMLDHWRDVDAILQKTPGVLATAPYVQGPVILVFGDARSTPILRGIDADREEEVTHIRSALQQGKFDLEMDAQGKSNKVVIGTQLAKDLGATIGDTITVYAPGNVSAVLEKLDKAQAGEDSKKALDDLRAMVLPAELEITGIFSSGRYLYDANYLLVSLNIAQELNGLGDGVQGISLRTADPYQVENVKQNFYVKLSHTRLPGVDHEPDVELMSWIDTNHELFDALRVERNSMFSILLIIILVAGFCIVNTLITITTQKTREIGIMKALGATQGQIVSVFLLFGIIVDLLGTTLGLAQAGLIIYFRNPAKNLLASALHVEIFPSSIYQFSEIPATIDLRDVLIICGSAFVISTLAAFIPAYMASRLDPVKALRFE